MMRDADAPSVRNDELAAVTVPCGLMNAALSFASCSGVDGRMPLSAVMKWSLLECLTRTISSSKSPACCASNAFWCERAAKMSWSRRETPNAAHNRSALCPMISPVANSATPGATGARSAAVSPERSERYCAGVFILVDLMRRLRMGREKRMGRSDMSSTPPARYTCDCPVLILSMPVDVAMLEPMHASVTVCEGTLFGMPAVRDASRAMLEVSTSWMTVAVHT
mmetsp:Transcript_40840/g.96759  ORF Transcript_40840/g.96759 Transcript_40840/m.96759 type:complete len:224 (-) Transcript_40840:256-927(-)